MNVYAEYFELPDGRSFRRKTLLRFGNGNDLLGSAVLMNPGSAKPIGGADEEFIKDFFLKNHGLHSVVGGKWKMFSTDSTMWQLEKIFNGFYVNKEKQLKGVIQLFNLFYYRDQDQQEALKNFSAESSFNFDEFDLFIDKPVYFGWGSAGKTGRLGEVARDIFSSYNHRLTPVYYSNFEENSFFHPRYVNMSYKRNSRTLELMSSFQKLI